MDAVDWFRLLWDLVQRGHTLADVSRHTGISKGTLRGYLSHSQPPHWRGELLIAMWCDVMGGKREDIQLQAVVLTNRAQAVRDFIAENDDAVNQLSQIQFSWMNDESAGPSADDALSGAATELLFRVGLGRIKGRYAVFAVYDKRSEGIASMAPNFVRWVGDWQSESLCDLPRAETSEDAVQELSKVVGGWR